MTTPGRWSIRADRSEHRLIDTSSKQFRREAEANSKLAGAVALIWTRLTTARAQTHPAWNNVGPSPLRVPTAISGRRGSSAWRSHPIPLVPSSPVPYGSRVAVGSRSKRSRDDLSRRTIFRFAKGLRVSSISIGRLLTRRCMLLVVVVVVAVAGFCLHRLYGAAASSSTVRSKTRDR